MSIFEKKSLTVRQVFALLKTVLAPEKSYFSLAIIYGLGISLLSLATPISVQMLINTVANTGLKVPLVVLSVTLFGLLLLSGLLNALRIHLMEIFGRRFYARLVSEISLRAVYAQNPFFIDDGRGSLFNRYFDIITVQKMVPNLLIGGFTVLLQAGVGFVVVSLYHPLFLVFNLGMVALIWGIWLVWGRGAVLSVIGLSHKKHNAAAWLESLGASNGFFKSERHIAYALKKSETVTADYVTQHKKHFRNKFAQTISFLVLYAAASALLLGLGGWLVIQGQLTLGQLIAAELILSAAFLGVSQLGTYLNYFYDLCAAIEELSLFLDVRQEEPSGKSRPPLHDSSLEFTQVRGEARASDAILNFTIPSGACVFAVSEDHGLQRLTAALLKRHVQPKGGYITLGGCDIQDLDVLALRQEIVLLDRPTIVETTIRDFLKLSCQDAKADAFWQALRVVGLEPVIARLPQGLDTSLAVTGWPLSITETMMLKLAAAIVANPRVLILNQLFDLVPASLMSQTLNTIQKTTSMSVIYFSNRQQDIGFDHYLLLRATEQSVLHSYLDLEKAISETGDIVFISESLPSKNLVARGEDNAIS